jgi:TPR repeat protein
LLLRLAEAGDESSQLNVGVAYDTGRGVRKSRARALYWYRQGARRNDWASASNIGTIYRDEGRPLLALRWFEKAVGWGDADALLEIAKLYLGPLDEHRRAKQALIRLRRLAHRTTEATQEEAAGLLIRLKSLRSPGRGD